MIRPLRRRHRLIVCTLGVIVPVAFIAGIAARRPVPVATSVPAVLDGGTQDFGSAIRTRADLWPDRRILTSLRRNGAGSFAVELVVGDLVRPDVLVYWAAGKESAVDRLPDNARLLGGLSNGRPLVIPADARGEVGRAMLYSLADQQVVAVSSPITF